MPSQPKDQASDRDRLPFEPTKSKKKPEKKASPQPTSKKTEPSTRSQTRPSSGIPDAVSKRMIKRMAIFCGVPTFLGVSSFFVSYFVVINGLFELPTTAVLFISLGFFGLGVVGLSYGALSTSWDESKPGDLIGFNEFKVNLGRMQQAWKEGRNQSKST